MVGLLAVLTFVGAIWTVTEVITFASEDAKRSVLGSLWIYRWVIVLGGIVVFFGRIFEPRKVVFRIPHTQTDLTLKFSDIFEERSDLLIAVNEFFDSEVGEKVSPASVHGQLIKTKFNSDSSSFRNSMAADLSNHSGRKTRRKTDPKIAYPLGTTITIEPRSGGIHLFALTHSDLQTYKAHVKIGDAVDAIRDALQHVNNHCNGRPIAMPLIGNGQAGLNLRAQDVLRLLVLVVVTVARNSGLPKDVRICLHDDCFDHLDLREIARDWKS